MDFKMLPENKLHEEDTSAVERTRPFINICPIVSFFLVLFFLIHTVRATLISNYYDLWVVFLFSFIPERYSDLSISTMGNIDGMAAIWGWVTYSYLHSSVTHLILNSFYFLIFGNVLAKILGSRYFLILYLVSSIFSALFSLFLRWGEQIFLVGSSGVVSGFMGAIIGYAYQSSRGGNSVLSAGSGEPTTLTIFAALCFLTNIFPIFNFIGNFSWMGGVGKVAWESHLGGFLIGLVFSFFPLPRSVERKSP